MPIAASVLACSCGLDLTRASGSLELYLLWREPSRAALAPWPPPAHVQAVVNVRVEHAGNASQLEYEAASRLVVESVPGGESLVSATLADGTLESNRIATTVFAGEPTSVGVQLTDAPDSDPDGEGIPSRDDNCPFTGNSDQLDGDRDGLGDACDNCISHVNSGQEDFDQDGYGDACDPDTDGDGVLDVVDECPRDAKGAVDSDRDAVCDSHDSCPGVPNPAQTDCDNDTLGDACDPDLDNDGVVNGIDVCPFGCDPDQTDTNHDGVGDVCATDPAQCHPCPN